MDWVEDGDNTPLPMAASLVVDVDDAKKKEVMGKELCVARSCC